MRLVTRRVNPLTARCGPWLGTAVHAAMVFVLTCPSVCASDSPGTKDSPPATPGVTATEGRSRPSPPLPGQGSILEEFGTGTQPAAETATDREPAAGESAAKAPASAADQQVIQRRSAPAGTVRASDAQHAVQRPERGLGSWSVWDSLPLLVVLILIGGVALVVKRSMPARRMLGGGGVLSVLARLPVSTKQSLILVKMGRQLVLLGVSPDNISSLSVVSDPEQVAAMVGEVASSKKDSMSRAFSQAFSEESKVYGGLGDEGAEAPSASGHVKGLLDKVRSLAKGQGTPLP